MRLTIETILQAPQYKSPAQNWTINLRGCQLDTIENLGATGDYFECIDLSDNQIIKLQDIPPLYRLNSLIVCNNRVTRIAPDIMSFIPNLESLVLTNNRIERLVDLVPLFSGKNLRRLVLQGNPIKKEEKDKAQELFNGEKGQQLLQQIAPPRQAAESIREAAAAADAEDKANTLTNQQREAIKKAISKATSLEEINKLEEALKKGLVPEGIDLTEDMDADGENPDNNSS